MRRGHLLTDDAGYSRTPRYVRRAPAQRSRRDQYCGRHASASPGPCPEHLDRRGVGFAGRLRARSGRQPALRHRFRSTAAGPAATDHRRRAARQRSRHPRTTCPGGTARRRCSATPPSTRSPESRWTAPPTTPTSTRSTAPPGPSASAWCAPVGGDPGRRRPAGHDHRLGPADVGAAAGLAVARGRRRAQDPSDRRGRPPRHGHVERPRLPRPVRPPGDARPGAVRVRRRPGRQPRRDHP